VKVSLYSGGLEGEAMTDRHEDIRGHYEGRTINAVRGMAVEFYQKNGELDTAIPQDMYNHICDTLRENAGAPINPFGHIGFYYAASGPASVVPLDLFGLNLLQMVYNGDYFHSILENTAPIILQIDNA